MIPWPALLRDREEARSPFRSQGTGFNTRGRENLPVKGGLFVKATARN